MSTSLMSPPPAPFGEAFLDWFRARSEATWATYEEPTIADYLAREQNGLDWVTFRTGMRWLCDLTETAIGDAERRWNLRFPPDYRLFLQRLHTTQPLLGIGPTDKHVQDTSRQTSSRPLTAEQVTTFDIPYFSNWRTGGQAIQGALEALVEGLEFDIEHADLWLTSWGDRPATLTAQKARLRALVAAAPKLIPVVGHRFLLSDPCQVGNPVFSIWQSDIVVYGANLRDFLLFECAEALGVDSAQVEHEISAHINSQMAVFAAIPFWGALLTQFG